MPIYSYTYSIPYLVFLMFLFSLMFWEFEQLKKQQNTLYPRILTIAGFVFFFGFRGFIYTDWSIYYNVFQEMSTIWDGGLFNLDKLDVADEFITDVSVDKAGMEMGFIYSILLFKSIIPNYFAWVLFNVIVDVILLDIFFRRYSKYYVNCFILFIVFGGLIIEFNLMRNVKAILLFLISIKYIHSRQIAPFLLLNLIGSYFHTSALLFFPLYFFLHKEWSPRVLWTIFIVGNILFLLNIRYLETIITFIADIIGGRSAVKAKIYFESDLYNKPFGLGIGYIERIATFGLIMYFRKKLITKDSYNNIFINAYILYFIVFFYFAEIMIAIERISLLFAFSYWIIYPKILNELETKLSKAILVFAIIGYCSLKITTINANIFSKYDNLFFGIESYDKRVQRMDSYIEMVLEK